MSEVTPEDVSKGVAAILYDDLGLSSEYLLKQLAKSLKAYKVVAGKKHPDFKEIREASKDLLALLNIVAPTKHEVKGSMNVNIRTYTIKDLEEALNGG